VGHFRVEGNELTQSRVILREIRIPRGSVYREDEIQEIRDHLQRLEYFEMVQEPEVRFSGDSAVVTIRVKEGQPNTLDGVIGYTPSNDPTRPGYFTGRLHFNFRNFLGTGRFLEAFWEKKDKVSQAMRFGYEEPWVLGYPVHAGWRFEQEIRDTTYVDRGWRLSLRYTPTRHLSLRMEGGVREILPDSLGSVIHNLAQSKAWVGTLGFDYTTMDDPVNPSRGVRYHTSGTFGRKQNIGPDFLLAEQDLSKRYNTRHIIVDAEFIFGLWGKQALFTGLHGQEVRSGQTITPLSEQIRFGGTTTLRGYPEDAFRGDLVAWMNLEYRYLMSRKSRVFLFLDAGMYQRREEEKGLIRSEKMGYGFGIRLNTRLGIMGVDYGLGQGDGLMQGKVHVGLINRF
jgi:outer membrane protein assembly factor BamA